MNTLFNILFTTLPSRFVCVCVCVYKIDKTFRKNKNRWYQALIPLNFSFIQIIIILFFLGKYF